MNKPNQRITLGTISQSHRKSLITRILRNNLTEVEIVERDHDPDWFTGYTPDTADNLFTLRWLRLKVDLVEIDEIGMSQNRNGNGKTEIHFSVRLI